MVSDKIYPTSISLQNDGDIRWIITPISLAWWRLPLPWHQSILKSELRLCYRPVASRPWHPPILQPRSSLCHRLQPPPAEITLRTLHGPLRDCLPFDWLHHSVCCLLHRLDWRGILNHCRFRSLFFLHLFSSLLQPDIFILQRGSRWRELQEWIQSHSGPPGPLHALCWMLPLWYCNSHSDCHRLKWGDQHLNLHRVGKGSESLCVGGNLPQGVLWREWACGRGQGTDLDHDYQQSGEL